MAPWRGGTTIFDRAFFEVELFKLLAHFSATHETQGPVVELKLADGSELRLKSKVVSTDNWVTFQVHEEQKGGGDVQVTVPFNLITQVWIYPTDPDSSHIGFRRD